MDVDQEGEGEKKEGEKKEGGKGMGEEVIMSIDLTEFDEEVCVCVCRCILFYFNNILFSVSFPSSPTATTFISHP